MKRNLRVAAVQLEHVSGDKIANGRKIQKFVEEAAQDNVEIIVFPECCITGYWYLRHESRSALLKLAEHVPDGTSTVMLCSLASTYGMTIGAGLIEISPDGRLYNTYVIALPSGKVHFHRKIHCFISEHLESGSQYTVFDTPHGCRVGVLTCYDNNISENVRITALKGAEILLAPHQTGGCKSPDPHTMGIIDRSKWDNRQNDQEAIERELRGPKGRGWLLRWLPTRAHDNGIFLIFSNGVGIDDDEVRTGNAMILDPYGRILEETWHAGDKMVTAVLNHTLLSRNTGKRWLKTRRPELYTPLTIPTGMEEDTRKVRFDHNGI